ncbi:MAG: putrescine transport system ATP-binding protein, partial [Chloroflexota bacterium]|nr:putrescine transport system ATP-binding protein [Chloroflexota bacterium]
EDLAGTPPHRRPVHMMFQAYALFPHLSVARNIAFGLMAQGRPKAQIASRVDEMLALVKLEGLGGRKPDQLSGGQKQRVGIARCLVHRPALVLADEPTGQLDSATSAQVIDVLMSTVREIGATALVVTHDAGVAARFDRVVTLRDGRVTDDTAPVRLPEADRVA